MTKVVFGTSNRGKLEDVLALFPDQQIELLTPADIGVTTPNVIENGQTFEENALIKYQALRPLIPDEYVLVTEDSGIEIDALGGEPGVHSRRWNPERHEMSDDEIITKTLERLRDKKNRTARFVSVIAFGGSGIKLQTVRGELTGTILSKPDEGGRIEGLPYRTLFYVPQLHKMLYQVHEIPYRERRDYPTHREQVWLKLLEIIKKIQF